MIDQDWPFLHLNLISPSQPSPSIGGTFDPINLQNSLSNQHQILDSNNSQEISPLTFDPTQLEVWSNINFNFEELPSKATFDQPFNSNNSNSHSELLPESCNSLDEQKLILSSPVSNNSDLNRNRFLGHSNEALIFDSSSSSASNSNNNLKNILPIQNSELTSRNLFNDHSQAEYQQRSRSNTLTNQKQTRTVSSNLNNNKNLTKNQSADEFNRLNHNSDESPVAEDEELNRVSQEDEKRRRNTLASEKDEGTRDREDCEGDEGTSVRVRERGRSLETAE
ncbi:hypothetical protein BY996DRAFT_6409710 [Phakopsora pachyrhizi]|nr:hypothetical protein BY996DRAFT_6409710 [Phakopsora pachyrhizi]